MNCRVRCRITTCVSDFCRLSCTCIFFFQIVLCFVVNLVFHSSQLAAFRCTCGIAACRLLLSIVLYRIVSYCIVSYRVVSYRNVTYCTVSYRIVVVTCS